jgi:hypothetical protein
MPTKKKVTRKRGFTIFAFGAKQMKGLSRRTIQAVLLRTVNLVEEGQGLLSYVVMGNVRETEKVIYSICRKNHLPVAVIPADFESWTISAEHLRNGMVQKFFKPSVVVMAYANEEQAEEESVALAILRWARSAHVPVSFCGVKKAKEKENAKVKGKKNKDEKKRNGKSKKVARTTVEKKSGVA